MNKEIDTTNTQKRQGTLHLTQKVDYGLFLLSAIASCESEEPQSLQIIAKEHELSFAFLQQVARQLRQANLLTSVRGKSGGYCLTKSANNISVKEVIEALEGPIAITDCSNGSSKHTCPRMATCTMRSSMQRINDEIKSVLSEKTLAQIMTS